MGKYPRVVRQLSSLSTAHSEDEPEARNFPLIYLFLKTVRGANQYLLLVG